MSRFGGTFTAGQDWSSPAVPSARSGSLGSRITAEGHCLPACLLTRSTDRVVLAVLFLRYVVFEDPTISKRVNEERRQKRKRARSRSLAGASGDGSAVTAGARRSLGKDAKGKGKVRLLPAPNLVTRVLMPVWPLAHRVRYPLANRGLARPRVRRLSSIPSATTCPPTRLNLSTG